MALYFRKALLNYKHAFSCAHKTLCGTINIKAYFLHDFDWTQYDMQHNLVQYDVEATLFKLPPLMYVTRIHSTSFVSITIKDVSAIFLRIVRKRFNLWMFYELDFNGILINKKCQTKLFEKEELQIELRNLH